MPDKDDDQSMPENVWADMTAEERAAAFRAHHRDGMPYPAEVDVDEVVTRLQGEG
ncbi:hypothetical protein [Amycolatopsis thermoflava]|uniref:hypothetical protein n=1 Tax=Amycolatopsis thermoflava TaxID=84480 RepID=UPI003EC062BD